MVLMAIVLRLLTAGLLLSAHQHRTITTVDFLVLRGPDPEPALDRVHHEAAFSSLTVARRIAKRVGALASLDSQRASSTGK